VSAAARLAELHQAMDQILATLDRGEIEAMPPMLDAYDREVGQFCAMEGAAQLQEGVQALHDRQLEAIAQMRMRQGQVLGLMRQQRQSSRALHAYAEAGGD